MSHAVARQAARRIREHCQAHSRTEIAIVFHGGEPLLVGRSGLEMLTDVIREELINHDIKVSVGLQTNGVLFTPELGDVMLARDISLAVSLDGPPEVNDRYRVDKQGRPTSAILEEKLELLLSPQYSPLFRGFLCVIDLDSDPIAVLRYLSSYHHQVDFLFPHGNYERPPVGKEHDLSATPYADWLIPAFDYWFDEIRDGNIRLFASIISMLLGGQSQFEGLGLGSVDLVVVEANGEIEAVDTLKSTFPGAAHLGFDVFTDDFDTVAAHPAIRGRQVGSAGLCATCQACPIVRICGGGYLPHRYSHANQFMNPSVYCADLQALIAHIGTKVKREIFPPTLAVRNDAGRDRDVIILPG
jgi:uncharacterized protein